MGVLEPKSSGVQIGIDIGQVKDPTAICVAERQLWNYQHGENGAVGGEIHYVIRNIFRLPLKTPYPKVADRIAEIYHRLQPAPLPEPPRGYRGEASELWKRLHDVDRRPFHDRTVRDVLVDATGVGKPVVDLIDERHVRCTAVYLTGGEKVTTEHGALRLPKIMMVSHLQVLLQQRRIHLLPNDAEAQATADELLNFDQKMTDSLHLQMGAFKTGTHDDLAIALGLACWEKPEGTIFIGAAPQAIVDFFTGGGDGNGYSDGGDWTLRPFGSGG